MAESPINKSDLIEDNAIESIKKDLQGLADALKQVADAKKGVIEKTVISQDDPEAVKKYKQEIDDLRKALDSYKGVSTSLEEIERNQVKAKVEQQIASANMRKEIRLEIKAREDNESAYERLNAQLEINRKRVKDLLASNRALTKEEQNLVKETQELDKRMKSIDKTVGQNNRNVGNYKQSILQSIPALKGMRIGQEGLNTAMKANPVGLIITAITTLTSLFTNNAKVTDFLTFAMAGLNKAFQVIIDTVVKLLPDFKAVFEDPKKAALDFVNFIKNNLINRIKSLGVAFGGLKKILKGDFEEGLKDVGNAVIQFNTGIENGIEKMQKFGKTVSDAAQEGFNASKAMDEFTVTLAKNEQQIIKNEKRAQALEQQLRNESISLKERAKIADEIVAIDIKNAEIREKLAKEELRATELSLKNKTKNADEEAQLIRLQTKVLQAESDKQIAIEEGATRKARLLKRDENKKEKNEKKEHKEDLSNLEEQFLLDDRERLILSFQKKLDLLKKQGEEETELAKAIKKAQQKALKDFDENINKIEQQRVFRENRIKEKLEIQEMQNRLDRLGKEEVDKREEIQEEIRKTRIKHLKKMQNEIMLNDSISMDERILMSEQYENEIIKLSQNTTAELVKDNSQRVEQIEKLNESLFRNLQILDKNRSLQNQRLVEREQRQLEFQQALATAGLQNNLAEQQAALDKAEAQRERQEKRERLRAKAQIFTQTFLSEIKANSGEKNAYLKALGVAGIAAAAVPTFVGSFEKGTDDTGSFKGGAILEAHERERILPKKYNLPLLKKGYTNEKLFDTIMAVENGDLLSRKELQQLANQNIVAAPIRMKNQEVKVKVDFDIDRLGDLVSSYKTNGKRTSTTYRNTKRI